MELIQMDSLLFERGFNHSDTASISPLIMDDLEFYHDKYGITSGKTNFLQSIVDIAALPFKVTRKLVVESVEVFPMYIDNGAAMYAAIQSGTHEFYQQLEGEGAQLTGTARFTHLWILDGNRWKLKRVLSYDHREAH